MRTEDRLTALIEQIKKGSLSGSEITMELHKLLDAFSDTNYREKILSAAADAEVFFSPSKVERHGGHDRVRLLLLNDLKNASDSARQLQKNISK